MWSNIRICVCVNTCRLLQFSFFLRFYWCVACKVDPKVMKKLTYGLEISKGTCCECVVLTFALKSTSWWYLELLSWYQIWYKNWRKNMIFAVLCTKTWFLDIVELKKLSAIIPRSCKGTLNIVSAANIRFEKIT